MTLTARPDRRLVRHSARSQRFVLARITAPAASRRLERAPVNLAFALDRSGSMGGEKMRLARRAVEEGIRRLDPRDRFAVVSYDDSIDVVVESTPASTEAKRNALAQVARIDARGSTNLAEGWLRGCDQVARHQRPDQVDRCLLLTDGLANVGITDRAELEKHAAEIAIRGIITSTFGVGIDFDEQMLDGIASNGRGNFRYVQEAVQIPDYITSEVGETLEIVARATTLEIETEPGVLIDPIGPYRSHTSGTRTVVELGDLVSEQHLDIVLRLAFPHGQVGTTTRVVLALHDRDGALDATPVEISWEYADHHRNDAQARDREVDRAVALQFTARARQDAVALNKAGRYGAAAERLASVGRRIRGYAGSDPELNRLAEELDQQQVAYATPVAPAMLKELHFASVNLSRSRNARGGARKER